MLYYEDCLYNEMVKIVKLKNKNTVFTGLFRLEMLNRMLGI